MGYQVLARKWRPRAFTEMVGQEHVLRALINGLDNDRLHHAYLFTGTRGVGKTTLARILSKCLNCEEGVSSTPCNQCGSCTEIAEGRFVDLIEVDAASRTKVEDTRELLDNVQYLPTRGRYKVYLIDEVHMLSGHSFNALLKTLEEPPPHVKFLLATTDPHKLPVTILSRCLQFNLKNLSPERIVGHLKFVLGEEKIPFEESALWELGRSADGSMRDALSLTDQAIAHGAGTLTAAEVNAMLGTIDRSSVVEICQGVAEGDAQKVLGLVDHMADHSPDYSAALADMLALWHQVAIAQTVPDALDPVHEYHQEILALANQVSREDIQLFYQMTLLGRKDLAFSPDPRSGFEMVLLRLMAFRPVTPDQAEAPVTSGSGKPVASKPEASKNTVAPAVSAIKPNVTEEEDLSSVKKSEPADQQVEPVQSTGHQDFSKKNASPQIQANDSLESVKPALAAPQSSLPNQALDSPRNDGENGAKPPQSLQPRPSNVTPIRREQTATVAAGTSQRADPSVQPVSAPDIAVEDNYESYLSSMSGDDRPAEQEKPATDDGLVENSRRSAEVGVSNESVSASRNARSAENANGTENSSGAENSSARITRNNRAEIDSAEKIALSACSSANWHIVCEHLGQGGLLHNTAINLVLQTVTGAELNFVLDRENSALYDESQQQRLAEALTHYFNTEVVVVIRIDAIDGESPRRITERLRAERLQAAVESLRADPYVQELTRVFGAELVESSVQPIDQ